MKRLLLILFLALASVGCKAQDFISWVETTQQYENIKYGALYNGYVPNDVKNLTSSNEWVVPNVTQWLIFIGLGGNSDINSGARLKQTGFDFWDSPNTDAVDLYGFSFRGGGQRNNITGVFENLKGIGVLRINRTDGIYWSAGYNYANGGYSSNLKTGASIRLLYVGSGAPTSYTGNDGKKYPVVLIGSQYWMAANLAETKYRNGDWIPGYDGGVYTPISDATWAASTTGMMCFYNDDINNK